MVEPEPVNRFPDAKTALEALQPLYIVRIPDITFDKSELQFVAGKVGEKLSQTITLKNTVSETILQGQWYVAPHPNDPPHTPDDHVWIRITPKRFEAHHEEEVTCTITIDTSKLKADKFYQREIVLESNANEERIRFNVSIQTAKIKFDVAFPPYLALLGLGVFLAFSSVGMFNVYGWSLAHDQNSFVQIFSGLMIGGLLGGSLSVILVIILRLWMRSYNDLCHLFCQLFYEKPLKNRVRATSYILLTSCVSISTGLGFVNGFNTYLLTASVLSAVSLTGLSIYPPLRLNYLKSQYRQQESRKLIEP